MIEATNKDRTRWNATGVQDRGVSFGVLYFGRRREKREKRIHLDFAIAAVVSDKCNYYHLSCNDGSGSVRCMQTQFTFAWTIRIRSISRALMEPGESDVS